METIFSSMQGRLRSRCFPEVFTSGHTQPWGWGACGKVRAGPKFWLHQSPSRVFLDLPQPQFFISKNGDNSGLPYKFVKDIEKYMSSSPGIHTERRLSDMEFIESCLRLGEHRHLWLPASFTASVPPTAWPPSGTLLRAGGGAVVAAGRNLAVRCGQPRGTTKSKTAYDDYFLRCEAEGSVSDNRAMKADQLQHLKAKGVSKGIQ